MEQMIHSLLSQSGVGTLEIVDRSAPFWSFHLACFDAVALMKSIRPAFDIKGHQGGVALQTNPPEGSWAGIDTCVDP